MLDDPALRLFVYGTLLSGEPSHDRLANAEPLGACRTAPMFDLIDLGPYPALVAGGETSVSGELYLLKRSELLALDVFEEVPILYQRIVIPLDDDSQAHTYVMARDQVRGRRRLHGGDWRKRFTREPRPEFTFPSRPKRGE